MDSFFSLFDPSDDHKHTNKKKNKVEQDSIKKKTDPPKGRRRGRKLQGKSESLPEESSFLCEPQLSTDLLVKDGSYIENYIEVNKPDDTDRKIKCRNSGRKNRRKKNKISPAKDIVSNAWSQEETIDDTSWNNQACVEKISNNIGKNVNDLKSNERMYADKSMYNVIDKLEKVRLKDDLYVSGDFDADDLDDFFYSSEEIDDSFDDSTTEMDDSGDEVYGSLPPEPRFGNVEYKLQLVSPSEKRFQHLVTQLKWRLRSGGGSAVYVVGVRDCGALRGLSARALRASVHTLRRMAAALHAAVLSVHARRLAPQRALAELYIRKLADTQSVELRVAVMGANEAGKSTLIGVLTQGELDNGRGSARLNMFRHLHEVKSGRTSSLSHEILGFDAQGNVVNYGCSELMTAERIGERSARLVSFLDLAGHSKYQRTTLHGLTGYSPHYAVLVISATTGVSPITEEHLSLLLALDVPFCVVLTKCELAPHPHKILDPLANLLAPSNKKPILITDEAAARNYASPQKLILDCIDGHSDSDDKHKLIGVFPVSCVKGNGLSALHALLLHLPPPLAPDTLPPHSGNDDEDTCEFQIDEVFHVGDSTGPVVGGLLAKGKLYEGDRVVVGPLETGEFVWTEVVSIYRNRVPCGGAAAGHCASLGLPPRAPPLRPGMALLTLPPQKNKNEKNLQHSKEMLNKIESTLTKKIDTIEENIYSSDTEEECKKDEIPLEDPYNPRGCIFFQAQIEVLRHPTTISTGFQCTVHAGNVRQTAIIEGILCGGRGLRAGERGACVFRFVRCPEYLRAGRRLLLTAGTHTRAIGRVSQVFPYVP